VTLSYGFCCSASEFLLGTLAGGGDGGAYQAQLTSAGMTLGALRTLLRADGTRSSVIGLVPPGEHAADPPRREASRTSLFETIRKRS
jgi:hypothetical protein